MKSAASAEDYTGLRPRTAAEYLHLLRTRGNELFLGISRREHLLQTGIARFVLVRSIRKFREPEKEKQPRFRAGSRSSSRRRFYQKKLCVVIWLRGPGGAAPGQDASLIFPASFSSVALGFGSSLRASDSRFKSLAVNQRMFLPGNGVIIIIPRGRGVLTCWLCRGKRSPPSSKPDSSDKCLNKYHLGVFSLSFPPLEISPKKGGNISRICRIRSCTLFGNDLFRVR